MITSNPTKDMIPTVSEIEAVRETETTADVHVTTTRGKLSSWRLTIGKRTKSSTERLSWTEAKIGKS